LLGNAALGRVRGKVRWTVDIGITEDGDWLQPANRYLGRGSKTEM
jgi:hypothetical protein